MDNKKKSVDNEQKYTSIQVTSRFKEWLDKVKKANHFDSFENVIKYLIKRKR